MKEWLKEPLLHFLLIGAAIFALYAWVAGVDEFRSDEIRVTAAKQQNLALTFSRTRERLPTQAEMDGLVQDYIHEEIAYREGLEMQLDVDDIIIRRRLRQKLETFAEDVISLAPPSDAELQRFLEENAGDYRIEPVYTFVQIIFHAEDDPETARARATAALQALKSGEARPESVGDSSLLRPAFIRERAADIDTSFGTGFASQLESLPLDEWAGPVESGFGLHLVTIAERTEARQPNLDEVRDSVMRDLESARYTEGLSRLYETLASKYTITIDPMSDGAAAEAMP